MISNELAFLIEKKLSGKIAAASPVHGGNVNRAFKIELTDGRIFFLKTNPSPQATEMFRTEKLGLQLLGASKIIRTPEVIGLGKTSPGNESFLILQFVPSGWKNRLFWENFGTSLADLHINTSEQFGFSHPNFIGPLPQSNRRHDTWQEFYTNERLLPQMLTALEKGTMGGTEARQLENICNKISWICPDGPPALTHGDLWAGNFICDPDGRPVLIDPAASFAHREMDLAMSRLFGGFDPAFYQAYQTAWPLDPGFEGRTAIYQLYYLLVHANLFGGAYIGSVREILDRFG